MLVNIIVTLLLAAYSIFNIVLVCRNFAKTKKSGVASGCFSCSAFKDGSCARHSCAANAEAGIGSKK